MTDRDLRIIQSLIEARHNTGKKLAARAFALDPSTMAGAARDRNIASRIATEEAEHANALETERFAKSRFPEVIVTVKPDGNPIEDPRSEIAALKKAIAPTPSKGGARKRGG